MPLKSVFENDHVGKIPNGKKVKMNMVIWPQANAKRMITHPLQQLGIKSTPCLEKIDNDTKILYQDQLDRNNSQNVEKKTNR